MMPTTSIAAPRDAARGCRGFTLVELLVASTIGLVVMGSLATLFGMFTRGVSNSRQLAELTSRMRSTAWLLRQDLQGATTEARPYIRPEAAQGYFELIEGPLFETGTTTVADVDDILMLTTAAGGRPFTGMLSGTLGLESPVAEVAWFCKLNVQTVNGMQLYNLYRRQFLVMAAPGAGAMSGTNQVPFTTWDAFYPSNDLSVRREGSVLIANSLADLSRRQSRFFHNVSGTLNPGVRATWPQITTAAVPGTTTGTTEVLTSVREGEDLMLTNVVAFDVRVFDPQQASGGGYVDLGKGGGTVLAGAGASIPFTGMPTGAALYDTWSQHTEVNNVQDSAATIDRGTNLEDDNGNGVVDDVGELEQPPPYNVPLRGVEIRIRCYEPTSQEIRQFTVQHSFRVR